MAETVAWLASPGSGAVNGNVVRVCGQSLLGAYSPMSSREMSRTPAMLPLFARAGAALVPGASRLPFIAGGGGQIPDVTFDLSDVAVDRERLEAHERVCGFATGGPLPASYLHTLAFPLQLALMSDGRFPVPALGLVHIANRIVQRRPLSASERLSLRVSATALAPHPAGGSSPSAPRRAAPASLCGRRSRRSSGASSSQRPRYRRPRRPSRRMPSSAPPPSGDSTPTSAGATPASPAI